MYVRQFLNDETACASYLFGCKTVGEFAVVDAHVDLVDDYIAAAGAQGAFLSPEPLTDEGEAWSPSLVAAAAR